MIINRRKAMAGAGAVAGLFHCGRLGAQGLAPIDDAPPTLSDDELLDVFVSNAEPAGAQFVNKGLNDWPLWWDNPLPLERAVWPDDEKAIDYAHIRAVATNEPFTLNHDVLQRLLSANGFTRLVPGNRRVLFGLRGCVLAAPGAPKTAFADSIELLEKSPDHYDYRCVIGVWDRVAKKVWAGPGSTVPHVAYLYAQREAGTFATEANMMPTGLYRYKVGTHRNGSKSRQPGAFRPDNKGFAVLRCVEDGPISMSRDRYWDIRDTTHGDNIHAGTYSAPREDRPNYWSAGCQVIPGYYNPNGETPQGDWARFRIAAGLARSPALSRNVELDSGGFDATSAEDGRRYSYLLITGREARLAATNVEAISPRLRFGSYGATVKKLQAALGVSETNQDGIFGVGTQRRLIEGGHSDTGIVDEKLFKDFDLT